MSGVPNVRATGDPRLLPVLRQQLLDFAERGGVWERSEVERAINEIAGPDATSTTDSHGNRIIAGSRGWGPDELTVQMNLATMRGRNSMSWYRAACEAGQLVYVTADLVDVVEQAAASVPDELTITLDDLPAPYGVVVLERPIYGTDAGPERPGQPVRVDGVIWGTAKLPPSDMDWLDPDIRYTQDSLSVGALRWVEADHGDVLAETWPANSLPIWVPMGRSDWPYGQPVPVEHRPGLSDAALTSMVEDRRFIAALFAVLNQRRLVETTTVTAAVSRQQRRQAERKGRSYPDVVVVHLRRTEYQPVESNDGRRHVGVRFPVRPFFRRQPYGPRVEGRHKLVLVAGHWRGPEGAPVKHVERVWSLDR